MGGTMIRDDPNLDPVDIAACLDANYGLDVDAVTFLPLGFDLDAAVYDVLARGGTRYFLKLRARRDSRAYPVTDPDQAVARALADAGVLGVVAPLPTRSSALSCRLGPRDAILYPFVDGVDATVGGMSDRQWVAFGDALRAVHDSGLHGRFRDDLPVEAFDLPSAALVRRISTHLEGTQVTGAAAARLAAVWRRERDRVDAVLARAEGLGRELRAKPFELVLCHADIHAGNVLVTPGDDRTVHLVDWDGPIVAPRERDLLFVVGSTIARTVEPYEEALFFEGYGPVEIDPAAIVYYRYERFVQDLGEVARSVLLDPIPSEAMRHAEVDVAVAYLAPGGYLDRAETVDRRGR